MRRHLVPIMFLLLATAACGSDSDSTTVEPPDVRPPDDPGAVVVQLDVGVNQPDPLAVAGGHPIFTLYADGRVIARDRSVESGALPPLVEARIDADGVQLLLDEAVARGALDPLDDYGVPELADADSRTITIATADQRVEFRVSVFGSVDDVTSEQAEARRALDELEDLLLDWQIIAADHVVEEPTLFTGESVLVLAEERRLTPEEDELFGIRADGAIYDTRVAPILCVELTGAALGELLPLITDPAASSAWTSELRPVFPDEPGCDLVPQR